MRRMIALGALGLLALSALGCGGSSYAYDSESSPTDDRIRTAGGATAPPPAAPPPAAMDFGGMEIAGEAAEYDSGGADWDDGDFEAEPPSRASVSDVLQPSPARMANNAPPPPQQAQQTNGQAGDAAEASDGVDLSGPLLIYTARFNLGVYEVTQTQEAILEQLAELDVILSRRTDTELVLRVPAARFQQALDLVEGAGDVLHREVNVQDVGEEFRDVAIRLRNAEVMRDRLERLLERANAVSDALAIERELQRLTDIIERFKGRQRFLSDQIRFSTITVIFQPLSTEPIGPDGFTLPFDWLSALGLSNLMRLQ